MKAKYLLFCITAISAFFLNVGISNAFTLSGATQTKITDSFIGFSQEYLNQLVQETIIANNLDSSYSGNISTYTQFYGNAPIWGSESNFVMNGLENGLIVPDTIAYAFEINLIGVRGIAGDGEYGMVEIPPFIFPELLEGVIENYRIRGNIVFKKVVDTALLSNGEELVSDGTSDDREYLPGFLVQAIKESSSRNTTNSGNAFGYLFKLKDRLGKRLFNVSE